MTIKQRKTIKIIIIVSCIILAVAVFLNLGILWYDISNSNVGVVTNISTIMKSTDEVELRINYINPMGGYSVREVPEDEGEYIGDGMIDYDGSLGKYRIIIKFGDIDYSTMLRLRTAINNKTTLTYFPTKLQARIACPSDHGFVLYIGSDTPIYVETVSGDLNFPKGTIKIPITVGD